MEEMVEVAERIARQAHCGQFDKAGRDYVAHPERVAHRVRAAGGSAVAVAAAWLHDVLEDTPITSLDLRQAGFPDEVIAAVAAVTKRSGEGASEYAARIAANPVALLVKRADLADNSDPERLALLPTSDQQRLVEKYQRLTRILDEQLASYVPADNALV